MSRKYRSTFAAASLLGALLFNSASAQEQKQVRRAGGGPFLTVTFKFVLLVMANKFVNRFWWTYCRVSVCAKNKHGLFRVTAMWQFLDCADSLPALYTAAFPLLIKAEIPGRRNRLVLHQ